MALTAYIDRFKNQLMITNERELHYKVIDFIRDKYPEAVVIPGLGENQTTQQIRSDSFHKGFVGGQPDILILNLHKKHKGFALEFKAPNGTGKLKPNQGVFLDNLVQQNYKTMVSDNFVDIVIAVQEYFSEVRIKCVYCKHVNLFKNRETRAKHYRYFHRMTTQNDDEE